MHPDHAASSRQRRPLDRIDRRGVEEDDRSRPPLSPPDGDPGTVDVDLGRRRDPQQLVEHLGSRRDHPRSCHGVVLSVRSGSAPPPRAGGLSGPSAPAARPAVELGDQLCGRGSTVGIGTDEQCADQQQWPDGRLLSQ